MWCGQTFILNIQMVAKLKTLKFTRLNKLFSYEVIQLWYREKTQVFTPSHRMNSTRDWYRTNRKRYGKKK